eukprot:TRINITY_DN1794_c0_g3_i4.p1 TRINITY_DN1794_c0_g3~~TRINITY_DN1794_c0_g3_i4.p1  ORF type:complete len:521 (+),score=136.03 TRINITY_DN1794_c0_g3_i4:668-2230(+)
MSVIASELRHDSTSTLVALIEERVPNDLLQKIAQQFGWLETDPIAGFELFQKVAKVSLRFADTATLVGLKLRQAYDSFLRQRYWMKLMDEPAKLHPILISVFEHRSTFVHTPIGEWEKECGGVLFPEHSANRRVGTPSVVSKEEFEKNFAVFTKNQFKHIDMTNLVVIGGAVCACALPIPEEYHGREEEYYNNSGWCESDVNLSFINVETTEQLTAQIMEFYNNLKKSHPKVPVMIITTKEAITFARHYPFRSIKIMGNFKSVYDVLSGIDIDCTAMAYDGKDLWALERARFALNTKMNVVEVSLYETSGAPIYEKRLLKYEARQFSILDIDLKKNAVDPVVLTEPDPKVWNFKWHSSQTGTGNKPGFGRKLMLLSEKYPWVKSKLLSMKTSLPYGPNVDQAKVASFLSNKPDEDGYYEDMEDEQTAAEYNHFDGYTHWYQPPKVVDGDSKVLKAVSNLHLTANHRPFLVPQWDVDMIPGKVYRDMWEEEQDEEEDEEEEEEEEKEEEKEEANEVVPMEQ